MFQSKLYIDLPSRETLRQRTVGEWFTSLFGSRPDLRSGREVLTVSAYAVLEGLVRGLDSAGMNNVISLVVDNKTVFLDSHEEPDDLGVMHQVAVRSGALNRRFREMHIALSHREEGLHIILDVLLRPHVLVGDEELIITLSARVEDLQHQRDESAYRYRSRLREYAKDKGNIEEARESLDRITARLASDLQGTLPGARFRTEASQMRLVRPSKEQIGRMRHLRFDGSQAARYRSAPARYRGGAHYDPFYQYYYDPFYDFALLVFVGAAIEWAWHMDYLYFVDPVGDVIGYAHELDFVAFADEWDGYDVLHFDDAEDFIIDDSIPVFAYEEGFDDFTAYDASWGFQPLEVFDPSSSTFVEAGWDSEPMEYSSFVDDAPLGTSVGDGAYESVGEDGGGFDGGDGGGGGFDGGDSYHTHHSDSSWSTDNFNSDDVYNASVDDWGSDLDDGGSWDDGGGDDWNDGGGDSWDDGGGDDWGNDNW